MVKVCKVGEHLGNIGNFCAPKIIIAVNLFDLIECAGAFNRKIEKFLIMEYILIVVKL